MIIKLDNRECLERFQRALAQRIDLGHKYVVIGRDGCILSSSRTYSQSQSYVLLFGGTIVRINDITYGVKTK